MHGMENVKIIHTDLLFRGSELDLHAKKLEQVSSMKFLGG